MRDDGVDHVPDDGYLIKCLNDKTVDLVSSIATNFTLIPCRDSLRAKRIGS